MFLFNREGTEFKI